MRRGFEVLGVESAAAFHLFVFACVGGREGGMCKRGRNRLICAFAPGKVHPGLTVVGRGFEVLGVESATAFDLRGRKKRRKDDVCE